MSTRAGLVIVDTCRECGCTEENACFDEGTGEGCGWANSEQTVCTVCAFELGALVLWMGEKLRAERLVAA